MSERDKTLRALELYGIQRQETGALRELSRSGHGRRQSCVLRLTSWHFTHISSRVPHRIRKILKNEKRDLKHRWRRSPRAPQYVTLLRSIPSRYDLAVHTVFERRDVGVPGHLDDHGIRKLIDDDRGVAAGWIILNTAITRKQKGIRIDHGIN